MEESLEECVQREIREETGLVVEDLKLLDVFSLSLQNCRVP